MTVASGATLGGTGILVPTGTNAVIVNGTLAPGRTNALGSLTVKNKAIFASGSTYRVKIQAAGNDKLMLTGLLQLNGATLQVTMPSGFIPVPSTTYTFVSGYTNLDIGHFAGLSDYARVGSFVIRYNTNATPKTITLKPVCGTAFLFL